MRRGVVEGTFENCAGGVTPWRTALSCEENIQMRVPEEVDTRGRYRRGGMFDLPGGHYGWVVEVDPHDPGSAPVKHTALGRFRHEGVGLRAVPGQPLAGYMGDDRTGGHVWKFVSAGLYEPGRPDNRALLAEGTLSVARFNEDGTGEWRPILMDTALDPGPDPRDPKPPLRHGAHRLGDVYASLGAALMDAYRAANAVGGTPSGRPEDVEVHPTDGSVFVAFTASSDRPGLLPSRHGEVWRLEEKGATRARARSGGRASRSVARPTPPAPAASSRSRNNLVFDRRGDLWVATDIATEHLNAREPYAAFENSGLFYVPSPAPSAGGPRSSRRCRARRNPPGPPSLPARARCSSPCSIRAKGTGRASLPPPPHAEAIGRRAAWASHRSRRWWP